jgi:hypothetical protein
VAGRSAADPCGTALAGRVTTAQCGTGGVATDQGAAAAQGLTLVHRSAQRKHILWDTLGALVLPSLSDRGRRGVVTKTA